MTLSPNLVLAGRIAEIWSERLGTGITADDVVELVAMHEAFVSATLGGRLAWAIKAWGPHSGPRHGREGATRAFQRAMSARLVGGRTGESYRVVLAYLKGSSEPSLDWIRKAADLLGVRTSWLAFGDGYPAAEPISIEATNPSAMVHTHQVAPVDGCACRRSESARLPEAAS